MKIKLVFLLSVFFIQGCIYACGGITQRVYAGGISYSVNPNNPFNCSVIITLNFDIADNLSTDSIFIDWGDGTFNTAFATSVTADSTPISIAGVPVLYKHVYESNHTYDSVSPSGFYTISPISQYRLTYASNIINGQVVDLRFYIEAQVRIDTTLGFLNHAPVVQPPLAAFAYANTPFNQSSSCTDVDGDSITFDLLTPLVSNNIQAPSYLFPNQYCQNLGDASSLSINHSTGELIWNAPCQQGIFAVTRIIRKYRSGQLLGSVMTDENIYVSAFTSIKKHSNPTDIQVYPSPAYSFLMVEITQPSSLLIFDILGKVVMKQNVQSSSAIDISGLNNGVYFMCDDKNTFVLKFVKQ